MAKSKYIETLQEQYTKKDGKSVLRYKAPDNKWRYIQSSHTDNGMPTDGGMTKVTWSELRGLRDGGKLIPGSLYRITDYQCTTTQANTRSAGHQFDIVLLALSEDKLAEEGWAMMHNGVDMFDDYDIYTITFNDGVSKQVYYKVIKGTAEEPDDEHRIIDTETFLGNSIWHDPAQDGFVINTENKTVTNAYVSSTGFENFLRTQYSYNYFQNSNLSAWKVWYCLDNDTDRFAWADNRDDASTKACINENLDRNQNLDTEVNGTTYYGWGSGNLSRYTTSEHPEIGDDIYKRRAVIGAPSFTVDGTVESYSPEYNGKSTKECIDVHIIIEGPDGLNADYIRNGVEKIKNPNLSTIVMDGITYYTWGISGSIDVVTLNRIPKEGDTVYALRPASTSPTPGQYVMTDIGRVIKYHPEYNIEKGRGVIYRLIDEWNNDVAYDFKNVQKFTAMQDGEFVKNGAPNTWVYTISLYNIDTKGYEDGSLRIIEVSPDDTYLVENNNTIEPHFSSIGKRILTKNVLHSCYSISDESAYPPCSGVFIKDSNQALVLQVGHISILWDVSPNIYVTGGIYIANKAVLTET